MGRRRTLVVASLVFGTAAATACTVRDLDYLTQGQTFDAGDDAGAQETSTFDAGGDAGLMPCLGGGIVKPMRAVPYQAPTAGDGDAAARTCNDLDDVLEQDGKLVGLDQTVDNIGTGRLAGLEIGGCVAVEFPPGQRLTNVQILAVAQRDACGASKCFDEDPDGRICKSAAGLRMLAFAGPSLEALTKLRIPGSEDYIPIELEPTTRSIEIAPETQGHFVVVCRHGNVSVQRDDVGVDAIWTECR